MNYEQALTKALTEKWVLSQCTEGGKQCWCRIIKLETPIECDQDEELSYIVPSAAVQDVHAEHIVKLHNSHLEENLKSNQMADYILKSILELKDMTPQLAYQITKTIEFTKEYFNNKP